MAWSLAPTSPQQLWHPRLIGLVLSFHIHSVCVSGAGPRFLCLFLHSSGSFAPSCAILLWVPTVCSPNQPSLPISHLTKASTCDVWTLWTVSLARPEAAQKKTMLAIGFFPRPSKKAMPEWAKPLGTAADGWQWCILFLERAACRGSDFSDGTRVWSGGLGALSVNPFSRFSQPQSKSVIHGSQRSQTWPRLQIMGRVQKSCSLFWRYPFHRGQFAVVTRLGFLTSWRKASPCKQDTVLSECSVLILRARAAGCHFGALRHLELLRVFVNTLSTRPFVIPASPALVVCSTPLLSDRAVYSGCVGWSVLFSRASCFAAAPKCLFLFQIFRDLFVTGISVRASADRARTWFRLGSLSHVAINHWTKH